MKKSPQQDCPRCKGPNGPGQMFREWGSLPDPSEYWLCLQCGHSIEDTPPLPQPERTRHREPAHGFGRKHVTL
ncbi:unnamed protein product [marine sediment metagenome]|uniref:Uncharacterized protein n=1 Tax=marine sediment metagenome TaxID=412755 RepID=X0UFX0_9ZZZZ